MKTFFAFFAVLLLAACGTTSTPPTPTPQAIQPPTIKMAELTIYFLDENRFATGIEPYEVGVIRQTHPDAFLPRIAVEMYFAGPTEEEQAEGLTAVLSGCTGIKDFRIENGVAHVVLDGPCSSGGSTYTIAGPLMKTLRQFDEINFIKLYDSQGNTEQPNGATDSIPFVLEP